MAVSRRYFEQNTDDLLARIYGDQILSMLFIDSLLAP